MSPAVLGQLLPIALVVLLLFVMVIRPARKRAQKVSRLQAELSPGDDVMLTSGIFGRVNAIEDDKVRVGVAHGVEVRVHRGAIAEIVHDVPADAADDAAAQSTADASADPADPAATKSHDPNARGAS